MSDEKTTYTVEEVRTAFMDGAAWVDDFRAHYAATPTRNERVGETLRRYPKPKKLREVVIGPCPYRLSDGIMQFKKHGVWSAAIVQPCHVRALADLLDRPYEDDNS